MRFSLSITNGGTAPPEARALMRFAAHAEKRNFYCLYFTDHYLYRGPTMHSVSAFGVVAAATDAIRIGFAAYVLPLRHPVAAARELATLDALSGGRLVAGLAAGSHEPEFQAFGIPFHERGRRLDEGIEALLALWTRPETSHDGRFWRFDRVSLDPNVVQRPHPPIWIGSWTGSPRAARRVVRYAAGWQASGLHTSVDEVRTGWACIEEACREGGRDPATIGRAYVNAVTWLAADREAAWSQVAAGLREREDLRIVGTPDDAITRLEALRAAGVQEVSFLIPRWDTEQLDLLAREVMPALG